MLLNNRHFRKSIDRKNGLLFGHRESRFARIRSTIEICTLFGASGTVFRVLSAMRDAMRDGAKHVAVEGYTFDRLTHSFCKGIPYLKDEADRYLEPVIVERDFTSGTAVGEELVIRLADATFYP